MHRKTRNGSAAVVEGEAKGSVGTAFTDFVYRETLVGADACSGNLHQLGHVELLVTLLLTVFFVPKPAAAGVVEEVLVRLFCFVQVQVESAGVTRRTRDMIEDGFNEVGIDCVRHLC